MMDVCRNPNLRYSDNLSIKCGKYFATQIIHADLRKYPENEKHFTTEIWESLNAFYRTCVNNEDSPFFLDQAKNYPTINEVANIIKESGGSDYHGKLKPNVTIGEIIHGTKIPYDILEPWLPSNII